MLCADGRRSPNALAILEICKLRPKPKPSGRYFLINAALLSRQSTRSSSGANWIEQIPSITFQTKIFGFQNLECPNIRAVAAFRCQMARTAPIDRNWNFFTWYCLPIWCDRFESSDNRQNHLVCCSRLLLTYKIFSKVTLVTKVAIAITYTLAKVELTNWQLGLVVWTWQTLKLFLSFYAGFNF